MLGSLLQGGFFYFPNSSLMKNELSLMQGLLRGIFYVSKMKYRSKYVELSIKGRLFMFDKKACGCRLKQLRIQKNMHQDEVAAEVGLSVDTISKLEQGRRAPSASVVCILADFYETSADYILLGIKGSDCVGSEWIRKLPVDKRQKVERMIEEIRGLVE